MVTDSLQQTFQALAAKYTENTSLIDRSWKELDFAYTQSERFYHNTGHLKVMLHELLAVKSQIRSWEPILFALFYHDVVYNPSGHQNEEDSANLARKRLRQLGVMPYTIDNCNLVILATKEHQINENQDINFFLDADLSVLGSERDVYYDYLLNIRKEYAVFPDEVYIPGRIKVLSNFLNMPSIFSTGHFSQRYEEQARINIKMEIQLLEA